MLASYKMVTIISQVPELPNPDTFITGIQNSIMPEVIALAIACISVGVTFAVLKAFRP